MFKLILITLASFVASSPPSYKTYPTCPQISKKHVTATYHGTDYDCINFDFNLNKARDSQYPPLLFKQENSCKYSSSKNINGYASSIYFICNSQDQFEEFYSAMHKFKWHCSLVTVNQSINESAENDNDPQPITSN